MLWHWWEKEGKKGIANTAQESVLLLDCLEDQKKLIYVQLGLPLIGSGPDLQEEHLPKPGVCIRSFITL